MIAAVVLAGGRARRLGGADKALITLAGMPLLDHVLRRLKPQVERVSLSANDDPARFRQWGLPVLPDSEQGRPGPLAGILAGLDWATSNGALGTHLLSVPVDTPFLPTDLVARLDHARQSAAAEIAYARSGEHPHFVVALWPIACRDALRRTLRETQLRRVVDFIARYHRVAVDFPALPFDPFLNINTQADLDHAATLVDRDEPSRKPPPGGA